MDPPPLARRVYYPVSPTGATNYDGPRLMAAVWPLTIGAAIFLGLRIYCKVSRNKKLYWDDYFLIAAWFTILVSTAMLTEGVMFGIGLHYQDMNILNNPTMSILSYSAGFATILGTAWSKTSFGITLLRISDGWVRWVVWFIIISINLVLATTATLNWVRCWPVEALWNWGMPDTCISFEALQNFTTFSSVYSGVIDIVLSILPWRIIWNHLTINKREKLGALIAMSMGIFSGIVSFLKVIGLPQISDPNSTNVDIKILGTAEPCATIMAVSIPVLRAFIRRDATPRTQQSWSQFDERPVIVKADADSVDDGGASAV